MSVWASGVWADGVWANGVWAGMGSSGSADNSWPGRFLRLGRRRVAFSLAFLCLMVN